MKIWTTYELQSLSRVQLVALLEETLALLAGLTPDTPDHAAVLAVLNLIRAVLAQPARRRRPPYGPTP